MTEKISIRGEDLIFQVWTLELMVIRLSATHVNSPETSIQNKLCCLHRSIYLGRSYWMVICSKTSHGQVQPEVVQRMYKSSLPGHMPVDDQRSRCRMAKGCRHRVDLMSTCALRAKSGNHFATLQHSFQHVFKCQISEQI